MKEHIDISDIRFESLRVPIDCEVELRFEASSEPVRLTAANISMSGMFLRSSRRYVPGTVCELDFELQPGEPRVRGEAEVLWHRDRDGGPDRPRGVGIRFLDLELESKYAISRLVDRYLQLGGVPVQLSTVERETSPWHSRRPFSVPIWLAVAFGLGLIAGFIGSQWLLRSPDHTSMEITGDAPRAFITRPHATPETPDIGGRDVQTSAIRTLIKEWTEAWSGKHIDHYLGCYSERFEPSSGQSLATWKVQRRNRLNRPGEIGVEIFEIEIETLTPDRARARFEQAFTSPGYRDRVTKTLELIKEDRGWKILREEVSQQ